MTNSTDPHTVWVHCSATPPEWMARHTLSGKIAEITRWHVDVNKWRAIAYNWLIDRDGAEGGGRDLDGDGDFWEEMGAGVRGHNKNTVHICLIGGAGSNENDAPEEHFPQVQLDRLQARLEWLQERYPGIRIRGHNEVAAKACPGFNVDAWWARVLEEERLNDTAHPSFLEALIAVIRAVLGGGK